ncbi:MAG: T9SS type A sorting domain-containing protein [Bacteroidetes bacterium]|nr:T9SS type A sorting domain-containing protein [Bacteroidota bacterium]
MIHFFMKNIFLVLTILFSVTLTFGQHEHHEFSEPDFMLNENIKKEHPEWADDITKAEKHLDAFTQKYTAWEKQEGSRAAEYDYIIPVVFHILHQNGEENITNKEVHDAMRILNEDFKLENFDTSITIPAFQNAMGDARIEFRLARKDPNGNPTNGIDRINTSLTNNAGEGSKLNVWPRNTYLNIWIVKSIASGAAGYTFLPSGAHRNPNRDGIILLYNYVASIRTGTPGRSRALTHEIGHWLNLPHPWGGTNNPGLASNCSDDDGVFDTPNTVGWRSCNLSGTTCGSLDNVQNFMDYSYCSTMFTRGQVSRMRAAVNTWVAERNALVSQANNLKAGVLDLVAAEFESDKRAICTNSPVNFKDLSDYGATSWSWEFEGGTPKTSTLKNPVVSYAFPGTFNVKLTVSNGIVSKTSTYVDYVKANRSVGNYVPVIEDFESTTESNENLWLAENEDNDAIYWKKMQGIGASGENFLGLKNFDNLRGMVESVVSPAIDLSNIQNPILTFEVATAERDRNLSDGLFKMYVSNDCGNTWVTKLATTLDVLSKGKTSTTSFTPSSVSDWELQTINNLGFGDKVENLLIKFEVENGFGNNVYIDNINIFGTIAGEPFLEFPRNGMDSVSTDIYLDWKSVPYVDEYELELSRNANFSTLVTSNTSQYISDDPKGNDTRFKAEALSVNTKYYWRVRSKSGSNNSQWSSVWSFTTSSSGIGHEFLDGQEFVSAIGEASNIKNVAVILYPNPAKDMLNIRVSNSKNNAKISVVNIFGAEVITTQSNGQNSVTELDVTDLAAGFYVVNVTVDGQTSSNKVLIQ